MGSNLQCPFGKEHAEFHSALRNSDDCLIKASPERLGAPGPFLCLGTGQIPGQGMARKKACPILDHSRPLWVSVCPALKWTQRLETETKWLVCSFLHEDPEYIPRGAQLSQKSPRTPALPIASSIPLQPWQSVLGNVETGACLGGPL